MFGRVFEGLAQQLKSVSRGSGSPPPTSAACCKAVFHECPLNDFWDWTGKCGVAYLARTMNNS